jgi:hypothetical protein
MEVTKRNICSSADNMCLIICCLFVTICLDGKENLCAVFASKYVEGEMNTLFEKNQICAITENDRQTLKQNLTDVLVQVSCQCMIKHCYFWVPTDIWSFLFI